MKIDQKKINTPEIIITDEAFGQLYLIQENELEITNQVIRIKINGKDCHGFKFFIGTTENHPEDMLIKVINKEKLLTIHMDNFTAFYLQKGLVDYQVEDDFESEGFSVTNLDRGKFSGKFWKDNDSLIPPQI